MADKPASVWRTTMKRRIAVFAAMLGLWAVGIQARLIHLQVFRRDFLAERAAGQQSDLRTIPANRGEILDRNGEVLAMSADAPSIYAIPSAIENAALTIDAICAALRDCTRYERDAWRKKFTNGKDFTWVRRQIAKGPAERVAHLDLAGVGIQKERKRYYPNKELLAHVLGYVGTDHEGLGGIERAYDSRIKGQDGTRLVQKDANQDAFSSEIDTAPTAGSTLELTIDKYIQNVIERELRAAVKENAARGATAIVQDPWTGELLGVASYPTFNPNAYGDAGREAMRNRAVLEAYEPGSTFKIVTASAALEQGVTRPDAMIDVSEGRISFGSDYIEDAHRYESLSFADVFVKSSNVGSVKVALTLGADRLIEYARRFGFGRRATARDFVAEATGRVWNASDLKQPELARVSIGYQISVTALQMATAVSSIANGGELLEPRVVRAIIEGRQRRPFPRRVVNRTVTPEVAAQVTEMMEGVVERGTATYAQIPGYTVAGKTGTAEKWVDGAYSDTDHMASFVGFVPSRHPVYTIVVVVDSPHGKNGHFGGPVAAPVFKRVAEDLLRYGGVPPTLNAPPPVLVHRGDANPGEQRISGPAQTGSVVAARLDAAVSDGRYPDLSGMSARDAIRVMAALGAQPQLYGTGFVSDQRPAAGAPIESGDRVTLWLSRRPPVAQAASVDRP